MENDYLNQFVLEKDKNERNLSAKIEPTDNPVEDLHIFAMKNYIKKKMNLNNIVDTNIYDYYSSLFKPFIRILRGNINGSNNSLSIFNQLFDELVKNDSNIFVNSYAGYGKTEFLTVLYQYLYLKYKKGELKKIPIYISLHYYNKFIYDKIDDFDKQGIELLDSHIHNLKEYLMKNTQIEVVLIVDGTDEFKYSKAHLYNYFLDIIENIPIKGNIIGFRKYKNKNKIKYRQKHKISSSPEIIIELNHINVTEKEKTKNVIKYFSIIEKIIGNINHHSSSEDLEKYILNTIHKLNLTYLDFFHLFLFSKGYQKRSHYVTAKSISRYYHLYLDDCKIELDKAAKLAFKIFNSPNEMTNQEKNTKEWWKVQKHEALLNYLTAYFLYLELRKDNNETNKEIFNFVYPSDINSFCKEIINETPDTSRIVYKSILKLYDEVGITAKTHFCYLLGRFEDESLKKDILIFLEKERKKIYKSVLETASPMYSKRLSQNDKQRLLHYRTICISLIILGSKKTSSHYIGLMLNNRYFDNLNRGFHLEYYGDINFSPKSPLSLNNEDNLSSCHHTFQKLYLKISNAIKIHAPYKLFEIDLYTLCSLAQHRHSVRRLPEENRRIILELIRKKEIKEFVSQKLINYLEFIEDYLSQNGNYYISCFKNLFKLKDIYRTGWINRGINPAESVASHVFGALLLAYFYLPETIKKNNEYNKSTILRMILIHDLAEAYIGDIPSMEKTQNNKKEEKKMMQKIDMLKTDKNISASINIYDMYKDFNNTKNSSINAMIARDFDKLDNLFQLYIYKEKYKKQLSDYNTFKEDLINKVKTNIGKEIIKHMEEFFRLDK